VTGADLEKNLPRSTPSSTPAASWASRSSGGTAAGELRGHPDGFLRNIKAFQDNDLIIAWYILDEPEGWWESATRTEADLPKFKDAVTQADPYRPSFFNYYA